MTAATAPVPVRALLVRAGNFLFRYRNYAFPLAILPLLALFPPGLSGGSPAADRLVDLAGILLALAGETLRAAVVGLAYIKRGGLCKRVFADRLVTEGLFAHARNPLYLGNILMLAGLLVIVGDLWVGLVAGSFFVFAYTAIVAAEEEYLRAKFGAEYEDYCRRVNRWILNPRGLGETLRSMRFNWRRVVIKEYSSVYSWTVVALLLMAVETLRNAPPAEALAGVTRLGFAFAAASALFLTVWGLKKSRRLADRGA